MKKNMVVTYTPDNLLHKGYGVIFQQIWQELKDSQWLIGQLFKRDFCGIYKQTFLGFLGPFIFPTIGIGTFLLWNYAGILAIGHLDVPYPIYAILGIAFWQLFSSGLISCTQSLISADQMLTKINFSKKSLVIASLGRTFLPFMIQLALGLFLIFIYKIKLNITILFLPLVLIPLLFFTLGLGFILALAASVARDVSSALPMLLTFLMFLTPVLYTPAKTGFLPWLTKFNPLYYYILAGRDLVLQGALSDTIGFLSTCVLSVFIFIFCLLIFHLSEARIPERI